MTRLVPIRSTYQDCVAAFRWPQPKAFNIAGAVCDRHADLSPDATALIVETETGEVARHSFIQIQRAANRLANGIRALGVQRGDRVAIILSQGLECLVAHVAAYKVGAIAIPLSPLFGPEGLCHRLGNSGTRLAVTNGEGCRAIAAVRDSLPTLETILSVDGEEVGARDFWRTLREGRDRFETLATAASDPALLIYTSGTTGLAKGALHSHRTLLGHLPGVEFSLGFFPQPGDLYWSPADWSWVAGLLDVLLPSLYHGIPVVARRFAKFDPEAAFDLMARHGVRNALITPTALKQMRQVAPARCPEVDLRSLCSGGEPVGEALLDWGRAALGLTINEVYGQTEANLIIGGNADVLPPRSGATGRAIPGHIVKIVDEAGRVLPSGVSGQIALKRPDPVMFVKYWEDPAATAAKFAGDWCLTGDLGVMDDDGYITFEGRSDDVINASGYRIGPVEIESCLMRHPKVALVGVVGKPDAARGEIVKAFVVPADGVSPSKSLAAELREFVRERLAAYQYPREIAFLEEMPVTVSGKIRRRALRDLA
jgi:acetyl-CoA synthetase